MDLAIADAFVGLRIEALPCLAEGVRAPLWPLKIRSGEGGDPWPFDSELAGLELGARELIKREAFSETEAEADLRWLASHGVRVLRVGEVDRDGRRTILAARSETALREGERAQREGDRAALGALLGYPRCCVEAYTALGPRDDALALALRLGDPSEARPAESLFLCGALALVSHLPCSADCAATLALGRAILAQLGEAFEARWRPLAARVHAIDESGRALALRVVGDRIEEARELSVTHAIEIANVELPELRGAALDGARLVLVADHRDGEG